jgi:hypothetical protein
MKKHMIGSTDSFLRNCYSPEDLVISGFPRL